MIKRKLNELRYNTELIRSKQLEYMDLRQKAECIQGFDYSKEKIIGGERKDFTDIVDKLIDLELAIVKDINYLVEQKKEIKTLMEALSADEKLVITKRYFECKKWEQICVDIHASWRKTHYIHASALRKLEDQLK